MPKLKKKIHSDFTTVHNTFLRDNKVGATERGVLMTMLSLPDDWNFSIKGLEAILPDGRTKIATALKNLEAFHYLIRKRVYVDGKIADWVYIFSDEPMENEDEEKTSSDGDETKALESENLDSENLESEKLNVGFQDVEKPSDNQILNNQILNNQVLYQSIYPSIKDKSDVIDLETHQKFTSQVKEQIAYDYLLSVKNGDGKLCYQQSQIDEIVDSMVSVMTTKNPSVRVNKENLATAIVQEQFSTLNEGHIMYVLECLDKTTANTQIRNRRAYIISALYNAPITIDGYIDNQVNQMLYG
ncbi:MAG: helix-turn-helix domain-containing protein [Ruminococcus sp.]|nr:helix-turn-helix domain-containing protein [Ruminococcus sp.]